MFDRRGLKYYFCYQREHARIEHTYIHTCVCVCVCVHIWYDTNQCHSWGLFLIVISTICLFWSSSTLISIKHIVLLTPKVKTKVECKFYWCDFNLYSCLDRYQPFINQAYGIAYSESQERNLVVFGDINARMHCNMAVGTQYIHLYRLTSMDEKKLGHHGKSLLHVCTSIGMLKANSVTLSNDFNNFTCEKHG